MVTPLAVQHCPSLNHTQRSVCSYRGVKMAEEFNIKCVTLIQKVAFRMGKLWLLCYLMYKGYTSFRATLHFLERLQTTYYL